MRLDYANIAPEALKAMLTTNSYLDSSSIDQKTRRLAEILLSQINGCKYCVWVHKNQARDLGLGDDKLKELRAWRSSDCFNEPERAALGWAEAATNIQSDVPTDAQFENLKKFFDERQIVDLTAAIANMNALNRLAISFRHEPPE